MTKTNVLLLLLSILIVASLCFYFFRVVKGSGKVVTENRQVKAFNSVSIEGIGKVVYTKGDTQKVSVLTDDNIQKFVKTETKGEKLFITYQRNAMFKPSRLEIHITSTSLNGFSGKGAVHFIGEDTLSTDDLSLSLTGKGFISLETNAKKITTSLKGDSNIKLSGNASEHTVKVTGNGCMNSSDLKTEKTSVSVLGNGIIELYATHILNLDLKGKTEVSYKGDAKVEKNSIGKNTIKKIN